MHVPSPAGQNERRSCTKEHKPSTLSFLCILIVSPVYFSNSHGQSIKQQRYRRWHLAITIRRQSSESLNHIQGELVWLDIIRRVTKRTLKNFSTNMRRNWEKSRKKKYEKLENKRLGVRRRLTHIKHGIKMH